MGRHDRAWTGMSIAIVGSSPTLPMRIEQAFAESSPGNELIVSSFERYEDAYDFVKERRDVGLLVLLDNTGELPPLQVFRELAKPFETRGFRAFSLFVHEGQERFDILRGMRDDRRILDYIPATTMLDPTKAPATIDDLWTKFSAAFEESVIPLPLQESLRSIATRHVDANSLSVYDRTVNVLSAELNLSWMDLFAVRWAPTVESVVQNGSGALDPHPQIVALTAPATVPENLKGRPIEEIARDKSPLPVRLSCLARQLSGLAPAELSGELNRLAGTVKPGAPALLRHLVRLRDRIAEFSTERKFGS